MDLFLQKAKVFALDAAKKSQELASQAAKMSQELATETAKRSKELAVDVTKKADQLKAYAGELTPVIASKAAAAAAAAGAASSGTTAPVKPSEEELLEYGITPELREFVQGLTIKTFRDFPLESTEAAKEAEAEQKSDQITRQDLSDWQERHAVLVLLAVQEMSDFRYVLCPRRMKESRFWKIYFTLINSYVAPYEARAKEKAAALAKEKAESARLAEENKLAGEQTTRDLKASTATASQGEKVDRSAAVKSKNPDDLDAYLMGVDSEDDGDDDDGFDADFDKLVNSTADSDDDSSHTDEETKQSKQSSRPSTTKTVVAVSEGSSDGELVEIPDTESDQAAQKSK